MPKQTAIFSLSCILFLAALCSTLRSLIFPFWFDEVCTVIVCRLPSASDVWHALNAAADGNPPFYYYCARLTNSFVSDNHLGYRLPSIIGISATLLCIYAILAKRVDRLSALTGVAFFLSTPTATGAASQARPYMLMIGFVACALLAWQRIDNAKLYALLLAIMLAGACAVHYYAILVWPSFVLAELAVWRFRRRFRPRVWSALLLSAMPLLLTYRLLLSIRQYYGQNFWASPSVSLLLTSHDWLFDMGSWGLAVAVVLTFAAWRFMIVPTVGRESSDNSSLRIEELVLALSLLWLPAVAVIVAKIGHGGMTYRYMQPAILGAALVVGFQLSRASILIRRGALASMLLIYCFSQTRDFRNAVGFSAFTPQAILHGSLFRDRLGAARQVHSIVDAAGERGNLSIIVSSGNYLPMAYYAPPDQRDQLYYLADPHDAVAFSGTDSVDRSLLALRHYFPLQVEDFATFAATHSRFLLISAAGDSEWRLTSFVRDCKEVRLIGEVAAGRIFEVTLKDLNSSH